VRCTLAFALQLNEKICATRRKVSGDIKVKENFRIIVDTHFIHYSFIWIS
jgi:hypothetical protein